MSPLTKTTYDSLGRSTVQYAAYGPDSTYADASSVANNTVLEQAEMLYDPDSDAIQLTIRKRYHNAPATQHGGLGNPSLTPNARVSYIAQYPDPIGRPVSTANYGTNGGTALSRPATAPARSDTVLVNSVSYDPTGMPQTTTDPAGMVTLFAYDGAGRKITITENYIVISSSFSSSSSSSSSGVGVCTASDDTNRVTQLTYTLDGEQATMVAVNPRTPPGLQLTTYTYGTTLAESSIAKSTLLRYVDYPDSVGGPGGTDSVAMTYNRQGQKTSITDQRGCVHSYVYDLLGRMTNDCVTTLGTGVDSTVLQLAASYEVRGMASKLTSYSSATPGSGAIVNDVVMTYNSFGQLITDSQSHSGAVVPGTTPMVQYAYADGSTNTIRPTALTYPNGRVITTSYGTSGAINDSLSRVDGLIDGTTSLVNYAYLGQRKFVQTTYPQPNIQYKLLGSSSGNSPAGDIYWGLDLFDRIIDSLWFNTATTADVDRIKYGYDRASNRIQRQNPVATAAGAAFDEFYDNDGLQRLKDMRRGTLNPNQTGIPSPTFAQCWTLDPTGNWRGFNESTTGNTWTTVQSRNANTVNEITGITNTIGAAWATPAYDAAGNMTTMPQPANPGSSYTATYDAWNRLISLSSGGNTVQQNQYDARYFRTVIQSYTGGTLTETRHSYFSSDWRCVEERTGTSTSAERQFVWGARYIDDLVERDRDTIGGGSLNERLYACQDANWNATCITTQSGTISERYAYSAYGTPMYLNANFAAVASSYAWEILYSGYNYNANTGFYFVRTRAYLCLLGAWLTRDPLGYLTAPSLYAVPSPLNTTDPFGLAPKDRWFGIDDPDFHDWVHELKKGEYGPTESQFSSRAEVENLFNEWEALKKPRGKTGKSGKGGKYRSGKRGGTGKNGPALGMIVAAGATYGYDCYVEAGEEQGTRLAVRSGLCRQLQLAIANEGNPYENKTVFSHTTLGTRVKYDVHIVSDGGKCWITASHDEARSSWAAWSRYNETITDVALGQCPAESRRDSGNGCKTKS